ncbi:MAG: LamG domain-containing protein, partial [Thermodesulfobacteriota bacterium]|nr:LamG domain-containing protein [Thermodesulfobacteriota bacterium]
MKSRSFSRMSWGVVWAVLLCAFATVAVPPAFAENLVTNGYFSDGNTGFHSGYDYVPGDLTGEGDYDIVANAHDDHSSWVTCYDHTSGDGLYFAANGSPTITDTVWETVTAIQVAEADTSYRFEAWITKLYATNPASLKFQLGDGTTWIDLGTTASLAGAGTPEWVFTYADGKFSRAGNYYVRLLNNNSVAEGNDFGIDDIYFGLFSTAPSKDSHADTSPEEPYNTSTLNRAPDVTAGGTTTFTGDPVAVAGAITVNDPDGNSEWDGGSIKVQITANSEAADTLYLPTSDPGSGAIWISTADVKTGSTIIGTADPATSVTNNTLWTITFNSSATNALVQSTARAILFNNESDAPGTLPRTVTFTATDKHDADMADTQTISFTTYPPSKYALHFTRTSNQYAATDSTVQLTEYAYLTIEAWIKVDSFETSDPYISTIAGEETATDACLLRLVKSGDNNVVEFMLKNDGTEVKVAGDTNLSTDTWYHVAGTYGYESESGSYKLWIYLNGVEDATPVTNSSWTNMGTLNDYFYISRSLGARYFDGDIDEVRLWYNRRTAEQIRANMYRELAGDETNLLAYYKMSDGSGTTLTDNTTTSSYDGTLRNSPTWPMSGAFSGPRNCLDFDGTDDYVYIESNSS